MEVNSFEIYTKMSDVYKDDDRVLVLINNAIKNNIDYRK